MTAATGSRVGRRVPRRMRSTALGELVSCLVLPFVAFGLADAPWTIANLAGATVAIVLLLEGATYWLLKARQVAQRSTRAPWLRAFAVLRRINLVLLAGCAVVLGWSTAASGLGSAGAGIAFWVLAAAEQVNYFHVQLMYDNRADLRRLRRSGPKRSALARDLRRAERTGRAVRAGLR